MLAAIAITAGDYALFSHDRAFYWLMALLLLSATRLLVLNRIIDKDMPLSRVQRAAWAVRLSALSAGMVWGASTFYLFDTGSVAHSLFLTLVLAGICMASLMSYWIWPALVSLFAGGMTLTAGLGMLHRSEQLGVVFVLLALSYLAVLLVTSRRVNSTYVSSLQLALKNREYETRLQTQGEQLEQMQSGVNRNLSFIDIGRLWSWETDAALNVTHLSAGFNRLTGVLLNSVLGEPLEKLFPDDPDNKNFRIAELFRRIEARQSLQDLEIMMTRPDGAVITLSVHGEACFDSNRRFLGYRGVARDITTQKAQIRKLEFEATHDSLTGLVNRRSFLSVLENCLTCLDGRFVPFMLVFIDLERLNIVNDTAGHMAGDDFLQGLTQELLAFQSEDVRIARIGGDEFGIVLIGTPEDEARRQVLAIVERIRGYRYSCEGRNYAVGAFAGMVQVSDAGVDAYRLMQQANRACHKARSQKQGMFLTGQAALEGAGDESDAHSVQQMFDALDNQRFVLSYQPVAAGDGSVAHFEVLLGQLAGDGEAHSSGQFIPAIERYGAMGQFDRWVIEQTCRQYADFAARFPHAGLFINLSGSNLDDEHLFDFIREKLAAYAVPRDKVCFEITETSAVNDTAKAATLIKGLRSGGCRFALDDFGTGMASLQYLKLFPVDYVKIDGSFVRELKNSVVDQAVLKAIAELSRTMDFAIVAESVEDLSLLPMLRSFGVSYFQGYGVARPQLLDGWMKDADSPVVAIKTAV
ncbi:EAL domain-containing protein [Granulosicoccaceae sp. 1_MG-2023]|nr:EAL domain-containing protein [Granulosicoccaceae sp. 1_MG-2023]